MPTLARILSTVLAASIAAAPADARDSALEHALADTAARLFLEELGATTSGAPAIDHTILVRGHEGAGGTAYTLEATGPILSAEELERAPEKRVSGQIIRGRTDGENDRFLVSGYILRIDLDRPHAADVYVDGDYIDLSGPGKNGPGENNRGSGHIRDRGRGGRDTAGIAQPPGVPSGTTGAGTTGAGTSPAFAGSWSSSFGDLRLRRVGDFLVGDHSDAGILIGRVRGTCAAGVFTNAGRIGEFRFRTDGPNSFDGNWAWSGDDRTGSWSGRRIATAPARLRNFTTYTAGIPDRDSPDTIDGLYTSTDLYGDRYALSVEHGVLAGRFVTGIPQPRRGVMAGVRDGNRFIGQAIFTRTGGTTTLRETMQQARVDLTVSPETGTFRDGRWTGPDGTARDFNLVRTGARQAFPEDRTAIRLPCR